MTDPVNTPLLTRALARTLLVALALAVPLTLAACGGEEAVEDTEGVTQVTPPADPVGEVAVDEVPTADEATTPRVEDGVQVAEVIVGANFEPDAISLEAGVPARLVFTRTTDQTCVTEVKVPAFDVGPVALPLNEPVAVEFTPDEAGTFAFVCGMDMVSGSLVVQS